MDMDGKNSNVTSLGNFRKEKEKKQIECSECGATPGETLVFVCNNCQCRTWRLLSTGNIECSTCGNICEPDDQDPADAGWRRIVDSAPKNAEDIAKLPDDSNTINNHDHGDATFARRRIIKLMADASAKDELMFVGGYKTDGYGFWWSGAGTPSERDWVVEKMEDMANHMNGADYSQNLGEEDA